MIVIILYIIKGHCWTLKSNYQGGAAPRDHSHIAVDVKARRFSSVTTGSYSI